MLQPRTKRPSLDFDQRHATIPEYSIPSVVIDEVRKKCKEEHFKCDLPVDTENLNEVHKKVMVHTFERIIGSRDGQQAVPALKEILAWDSVEVEPTNSIYLELIPEKTDSKDTILYAISLIEDLFIKKLSYKYIVDSSLWRRTNSQLSLPN